MPPKKPAAGGPSKKNVEKKKEKVIEDKTFGLKNKKGAKTQKFVQQVQHQVKGGGQSKDKLEADKLAAKKKADIDDLKDLNKLLKPVVNMPKFSKDTDPKSIVCAFFKQGLCGKGSKCKFSHDLAVDQKTAKRNLYFDSRDDKDEKMDEWDTNKLSDVAEQKHGEKDRTRANQTDIVCKFFIDAVENNKYGWFWECPNGGKCIYRHALPPGYVLKKDRKKMEDQNRLNAISLEELIEKERTALNSQNLVKVTLETFIAWKKKKLREKKQKAADDEKQKRTNFKSGKQNGLSGRDLFTFNPELLANDDDEADDIAYDKEEGDDDEENVRAYEIDENTFNTFSVDDLDDEEEAPESSNEVAAKTSAAPAEPGPSNIEINEDLFDDDELPDDLSDDEDIPEEKGIEKLKI